MECLHVFLPYHFREFRVTNPLLKFLYCHNPPKHKELLPVSVVNLRPWDTADYVKIFAGPKSQYTHNFCNDEARGHFSTFRGVLIYNGQKPALDHIGAGFLMYKSDMELRSLKDSKDCILPSGGKNTATII